MLFNFKMTSRLVFLNHPPNSKKTFEKVIELEMKIKEVRAERPKNRKETHENLERLRKLENERHSGVCLRNSKREVILKSNNT